MELFDLLNRLPGEAWLMLAIFLGATGRALANQRIPVGRGLSSALGGLILAYLLAGSLCFWRNWDKGAFAPVAGLIAFFINWILLSIDRMGQKISTNPTERLGGFIERQVDKLTDRLTKKLDTTNTDTQLDELEPPTP